MMTTAIRIDPFNKNDNLHPASRINYAKTYNIEHNMKVKPYGMVHASSMHYLVRQWTEAILGRIITPIQRAIHETNQANLRALGFTPNMVTAVAALMNRPKGPSAGSRIAIMAVARDSARVELQAEQLNASENLANHVVDLIQAGMMYLQAVSHVRRLSTNGIGSEGENDAVSEGNDHDDDYDDDDDEQEEGEEGSDESSSDDEDEDPVLSTGEASVPPPPE